jgi:hypothetical protein
LKKKHEVVEKRLSQKRAYLSDEVVVELFIALWNGAVCETTWWDRLVWQWPAETGPVVIDGPPVASSVTFTNLREGYADIIAVRRW